MTTNAQGRTCINWPLTIALITLMLSLLGGAFAYGITYNRLDNCLTREQAATDYVTKVDLDSRLKSLEKGQERMLTLLQQHVDKDG